MNNAEAKTIMKRIATLTTAVTLSIGATGISHAEFNPSSCQNVLQDHIDWLSQPPAGITRKIEVVAISTFKGADINSTPEVGYLETELNYGTFFGIKGHPPTPNGTLYGSGQAVLNTNRWNGNCSFLNCPTNAPFDPNTTETWQLTLKAAQNALEITKGAYERVSLPLDCSGNSIVATGGGYTSTGGWSTLIGSSKYELFLMHRETSEIMRWNP